jgi:regulatory protein
MPIRDSHEKKKVYWSIPEAKTNIERYCVFQDRCHSEVRSKLLEHGIYGDVLEEMISDLIQNKFLDEERFARSYVRGKFYQKKWGKAKILDGLKTKGVSKYCIDLGMEEIKEEDYLTSIIEVLQKKDRISKYASHYERKQKLTQYAMTRGYHYEFIRQALQHMESGDQ